MFFASPLNKIRIIEMYGIEFVTNPNSINDVISTTIVVNNQVDENASNPIRHPAPKVVQEQQSQVRHYCG